jgi:integrase
MASIRKRTWKSKDRDGQPTELTAWVVVYTAFDPKKKKERRFQETFATKKEAEAFKINTLHEVQRGTHTPASISKTVVEAWEAWLDECKANNLELGTILQRTQHLNLHVGPFIGHEKLSSLTVPRIHQFDADLRNAGRSLSMRRKILVNVKTMLKFAQGRGWVTQNVAKSVTIKDDKRAARGPLCEGVDFPSRTELKTMMEAAPAKWRPLLVTAVFTGMRASELRGLIWNDVDLDAGIIHVRRRADTWKNMGDPKSKAGKRDIPLAPIVVNTLRQWREVCPKGELGIVFPNGRGNVETLTNIYRRFWTPLQIKCGLTIDGGHRYGFHMLRHAAASLFIAYLGWTPKRVQTVMGHSSITMTYDRYGHLFESKDADREAMEKIEAAVTAA